jgi:tRNA A37 threonylcarbamoyladenosine modification protein TsaB
VVLDARRGQVYGAVYDDEAKIVLAETVAPWEEWIKTVPLGAELISLEDSPCETAGLTFTKAPRWLASAVAECAEKDGPKGWSDPVSVDANYVRREDAQMAWKDR